VQIALVLSGFCFNVLIAWVVGSTSNFIFRRLASCFTSFMTGSARSAQLCPRNARVIVVKWGAGVLCLHRAPSSRCFNLGKPATFPPNDI
jgi:hypothetical protein